MTKFLSILAVVFGFSMVAVETEAARVGSGKNAGRQSSTAQSAPAQKTTPPQATPAPAAPQSGMSKWLGPLAGLAAGIGLAVVLGAGFALRAIEWTEPTRTSAFQPRSRVRSRRPGNTSSRPRRSR